MMCQFKTYIALGFSSTFYALEAERIVKEANIQARLIPKPEILGNAECGLALRIYPSDAQEVYALLTHHQLNFTHSATLEEFCR